jgi:hypothetical protein
MTADEYRAAVKQLGLIPSNVGTVYLDAQGTTYNVQDPTNLPPEVRLGLIQRLRTLMGVGQGRTS